VKIKLTRPTVAGALAATLLSVGLVGTAVPAAFAAGINTETISRLTTGVGTVDPLTVSGTAASEVERVHVLLDDSDDLTNPLEYDIPMGVSAGVDPGSVAEQTWAQDVDVSALSQLTEGPILITTTFFDVNDVPLGDPLVDVTVLDLHAPTITSDHTSGAVAAGTQVTFGSPDADATLFFTVSHGGTAARPDPNTDPLVDGPITVTDAMQIKVLATDGVNEVVQVFDFTITAAPVVVPPVVVPPVVVPPVVIPPVVVPPVVKPVRKPAVKVAKLAVMRVSAAGNEFVQVKNIGRISVNLKGYRLRDRSDHVLTLPSYTLKPGSSVKVYTGKGKAAAGKLFLKKTTNVWSTRDTASLLNTKGLKVGSLRY
jgi:Lamin Tail Domain